MAEPPNWGSILQMSLSQPPNFVLDINSVAVLPGRFTVGKGWESDFPTLQQLAFCFPYVVTVCCPIWWYPPPPPPTQLAPGKMVLVIFSIILYFKCHVYGFLRIQINTG